MRPNPNNVKVMRDILKPKSQLYLENFKSHKPSLWERIAPNIAGNRNSIIDRFTGKGGYWDQGLEAASKSNVPIMGSLARSMNRFGKATRSSLDGDMRGAFNNASLGLGHLGLMYGDAYIGRGTLGGLGAAGRRLGLGAKNIGGLAGRIAGPPAKQIYNIPFVNSGVNFLGRGTSLAKNRALNFGRNALGRVTSTPGVGSAIRGTQFLGRNLSRAENAFRNSAAINKYRNTVGNSKLLGFLTGRSGNVASRFLINPKPGRWYSRGLTGNILGSVGNPALAGIGAGIHLGDFSFGRNLIDNLGHGLDIDDPGLYSAEMANAAGAFERESNSPVSTNISGPNNPSNNVHPLFAGLDEFTLDHMNSAGPSYFDSQDVRVQNMFNTPNDTLFGELVNDGSLTIPNDPNNAYSNWARNVFEGTGEVPPPPASGNTPSTPAIPPPVSPNDPPEVAEQKASLWSIIQNLFGGDVNTTRVLGSLLGAGAIGLVGSILSRITGIPALGLLGAIGGGLGSYALLGNSNTPAEDSNIVTEA